MPQESIYRRFVTYMRGTRAIIALRLLLGYPTIYNCKFSGTLYLADGNDGLTVANCVNIFRPDETEQKRAAVA